MPKHVSSKWDVFRPCYYNVYEQLINTISKSIMFWMSGPRTIKACTFDQLSLFSYMVCICLMSIVYNIHCRYYRHNMKRHKACRDLAETLSLNVPETLSPRRNAHPGALRIHSQALSFRRNAHLQSVICRGEPHILRYPKSLRLDETHICKASCLWCNHTLCMIIRYTHTDHENHCTWWGSGKVAVR